jgi:hypothetical protein
MHDAGSAREYFRLLVAINDRMVTDCRDLPEAADTGR